MSVLLKSELLATMCKAILPISHLFEHCVLRERVHSLNLLRDSLHKVKHYVGISK